MASKPWVIAHRGASGHAPENTLAAYRLALEMGAQFIEADIHLTRDAALVAIHDTTLERTTSGAGAVKRHTLEELRALDAGSWFGPQFAGEKIPTLEEILQLARERDAVFFLHLRADAAWGAEHALAAALHRAGEAARTTVLAYSPSVLATLLRQDPTLLTGLLFDQPLEGAAEKAVAAGARHLVPHYSLVTPELVAAAHAQDLQIITWTVNEAEEMRRMAATGVDGIMTDYPDRLVAVLKERGAQSESRG